MMVLDLERCSSTVGRKKVKKQEWTTGDSVGMVWRRGERSERGRCEACNP